MWTSILMKSRVHQYIIFAQDMHFKSAIPQMQNLSHSQHSGFLTSYLVLDPSAKLLAHAAALSVTEVIIFWTFLEMPPYGLWQVHLEHSRPQYLCLLSLNTMLGTLVSFQNQLANSSPYILFLLGGILSRHRFACVTSYPSLPFCLYLRL